jgi:hypothetical protein
MEAPGPQREEQAVHDICAIAVDNAIRPPRPLIPTDNGFHFLPVLRIVLHSFPRLVQVVLLVLPTLTT